MQCICTQTRTISSASEKPKKYISRWFRYFRTAIGLHYAALRRADSQSRLLGGPGRIVEIDETCFTKKRKYGRGDAPGREERISRWAFGAIERRGPDDIFRGRAEVQIVPDRTRETLLTLIRNWIHPESIIISDMYSSYLSLNQEGWTHRIVNHSIAFVDRGDRNVHTETIEGFWAHMKRHMNSAGGTRDQHLQERINEYLWIRQNFRNDGFNVWRLLKLLSRYGVAAKRIVDAKYS